jgi:hypothetical protein
LSGKKNASLKRCTNEAKARLKYASLTQLKMGVMGRSVVKKIIKNITFGI